jgi:hypothetical protein
VQGNLILTDSKYEILTLLRSHRDDAKGLAIMARHPYPIRSIRRRGALAAEELVAALAAADSGATLSGAIDCRAGPCPPKDSRKRVVFLVACPGSAAQPETRSAFVTK